MYDPNNPIVAPPGGAAITSMPSQGMPPQRNPMQGREPLPTGPISSHGPPLPGRGGPGQQPDMPRYVDPRQGMQQRPDRSALQALIESYRNSVFEWLQGRPMGRDARGGAMEWAAQRPARPTQESLLAALFGTAAPAAAPALPPTY